MKNLLFLVAITFTMLFTACSKNDESKLTDEEKAVLGKIPASGYGS